MEGQDPGVEIDVRDEEGECPMVRDRTSRQSGTLMPG